VEILVGQVKAEGQAAKALRVRFKESSESNEALAVE
jgi:hypothetical protein